MRTAFAIALCGLLAGCGFYLKGSRPMPKGIESVRVVYQNDYTVRRPPLIDALERRLRVRGALAQGQATTRLRILDVDERERVLAVSPVDGRAVAFQLRVTAEFAFSAHGEDVVDGDTVSVERSFSFDNTQRLAAEAERRELRETMQTDLADIILLRVETALGEANAR